MKKIIVAALLAVGFTTINAQEESKSPFAFSGYVDVYYSYEFAKPENHTKPGFIYSYNRSNEVNLNLGMAKVNYVKENIRANFALMTGTYAQYNMAAEQDLLKNIYEANIGVKISQNHNLWIDAGVMPSHIGSESAIGKDCMTLTRSIGAENAVMADDAFKVDIELLLGFEVLDNRFGDQAGIGQVGQLLDRNQAGAGCLGSFGSHLALPGHFGELDTNAFDGLLGSAGAVGEQL